MLESNSLRIQAFLYLFKKKWFPSISQTQFTVLFLLHVPQKVYAHLYLSTLHSKGPDNTCSKIEEWESDDISDKIRPKRSSFGVRFRSCLKELVHHLLTLKLIQTCMNFFLLLSTKEDMLWNVGNQTVDVLYWLQ